MGIHLCIIKKGYIDVCIYHINIYTYVTSLLNWNRKDLCTAVSVHKSLLGLSGDFSITKEPFFCVMMCLTDMMCDQGENINRRDVWGAWICAYCWNNATNINMPFCLSWTWNSSSWCCQNAHCFLKQSWFRDGHLGRTEVIEIHQIG